MTIFPLRSEYALTPLRRSMLEPLDAACRGAVEHWGELLDARDGARAPPPASACPEARWGAGPLSIRAVRT